MSAKATGAMGNAFKKMSQRAMWRGDRGQSQMLESHGMEGMRSNLLNDTPTYKKEAIGLNAGINLLNSKKSSQKKTASNNSIIVKNKTVQVKSGLGTSILNSL